MIDLFKIELDSRIMSPFTTKLNTIRIMLEDITFALQVAFVIATLIGVVVFLVLLVNLIIDYKTRILLARKGEFPGFHMDKADVSEGIAFPGYMISSSIAGFVIVVGGCTLMLTFLLWPLFWVFLWESKFVILSIVIPALVKYFIEEWIVSKVYE